MPFLIRYPAGFGPGETKAIATNVDFAPTFLDYAGLTVPSYMPGRSLRPVLEGRTPAAWPQVAYHPYSMHKDAIHHPFENGTASVRAKVSPAVSNRGGPR